MAHAFAVGSVVRLKSGGPLMTVTEVDGDTLWCVWFDKTDQKSGTFNFATVDKAT